MYKYKLKTCIMKKITALSIILIIGVLISAFTVPTNWETKKVNKLYSINIPDYLNDTDDLNSEASLQCENIDKETLSTDKN
jgi:hypothetical protein